MDTLTTNALTTFVRNIAISSNDEALLNTMFMGNITMRGALYAMMMRDSECGRALKAQYALERRVRAFCHLITRAYHRQQYGRAMEFAAQLNQLLALFAEQLLERVNRTSPSAIHESLH
ncbi:hypothetical protein QTV44_002483 [Vibrio vulnificus]|nr:hypothetical protein [Vibrio vulnificus]